MNVNPWLNCQLIRKKIMKIKVKEQKELRWRGYVQFSRDFICFLFSFDNFFHSFLVFLFLDILLTWFLSWEKKIVKNTFFYKKSKDLTSTWNNRSSFHCIAKFFFFSILKETLWTSILSANGESNEIKRAKLFSTWTGTDTLQSCLKCGHIDLTEVTKQRT